MNKVFCILEQGKSINAPRTIKKKELFNTDYCDFYRLNWKTDKDPNAFIHHSGIVWSEGRNLLYQHVPKKYDYYIFIDGDILFDAKSGDVPHTIKELLTTHRPISGTFNSPDSWNYECSRFSPINLFKKLFLENSKINPIVSFDLECQILSKSFAEAMFPIPFQGSHRTMHYLQWICYKLYPKKQLCFMDIQLKNVDRLPHEDGIINPVEHGNNVVNAFNELTLDNSFDPKGEWSIRNLKISNYRQFFKRINSNPVDFDVGELKKIINVEAFKECQSKTKIELEKKIR